jgi:hypothetical protein
MNIAPFSKHIFWSYKNNADLPESLVVQQVITYGEITDFRKLAALLPKQNIIDAIEKWQNKDKYAKHIHFLKQVFLYETSM